MSTRRRPRNPISCARLAVAVLLLATVATADAATLFDPALRFRTLTTEHFVVYFHRGEDALARRLAGIAEDTWHALAQPLAAEPPHRTHVVLVDQTELANGYATPVPYDTIVIYAAWPAGSEFIGNIDDWLRLAFTHEFTHIAHLDRSESWARVVRGVFGRTMFAFPNLFLPTWQIEGLATYEESAVTGLGRAHAGDFTAVLNEAARYGQLEPIDRVNGGLTDWPGGSAAYAYGVGFHEYLAGRFGRESLGQLANRTARQIPYTGALAFRSVFGESLGDLWRDYEKSVAAAPAAPQTTRATRLTHHGFVVAGPRFDPSSPREIVYSVRNGDEFPAMYRVSVGGGEPERLATRYLGSTTAPGRDAIYFDQQEVRRNVGVYSDLYRLDRVTGRVTELTRDARLMDPDLSPDEATIVAVRNHDGRRDLVLVRLKPETRRRIQASVLVSEPETQFNAPRWSPDGTRIAVERHRPGALSEVVIVDVATTTIERVASVAGARVVTPAWRRDGAAIVAAVAREGEPFNLVDFPLDRSAAPRRLTDTTGGALWPDVSPDGGTVVFVGYTPAGYDLFTVPYWSDSQSDSQSDLQSDSQSDLQSDSQSDLQSDSQSDRQSDPYSPLATLKPTSWAPILDTSGSQLRVGAGVGGSDILGYHAYSASATWFLSGPPGAVTPDDVTNWQVSYVYDRWRPTLFAAASRDTSFFAGPPTSQGTPVNATLRETQFEAGVVLPFRHARASQTILASALRSVDEYTLPDQTADDTVTRNRTAVRAAWAVTNAHTYGYSISPEGGVTAGTTIEAVRRAFGSSGDATTATADVRAYLPGAAPHHVLAIRAAGGWSTGDRIIARTFLLGGSVTDPGVASFGSHAVSLLRGFPSDTFAGTRAAVLNADYRWPLSRPQRGVGTWPIFLHTIHAAVFADAGHAWTSAFHASAIKTSFGGELSTDVVAGYVFPLTLAAGAAWGRDPSGVVGSGATAYFRVGKAF